MSFLRGNGQLSYTCETRIVPSALFHVLDFSSHSVVRLICTALQDALILATQKSLVSFTSFILLLVPLLKLLISKTLVSQFKH